MKNDQHTVLVVDDDEPYLTAVATLIAKKFDAVKVRKATTGKQAMAMAMTQAFTVILLDIELPDIDGLSVMMALRTERPQSRIILMTSHDIHEHGISALRAGAADVLQKPVDFDYLTSRLSVLLFERRKAQHERGQLPKGELS